VKLRVYNKTLDPNIWNEGKMLKPEVKESLLKIAEDFYKSTELKGDINNILFLGSSANYNWTDVSDVDLHIVIDITEQNIPKEHARKFMDGLASKWNTDHDIKVKTHPVEVYLQDISEPNATAELARPGAAIYSIFDDKWLVEPNPQNIRIDADKIRKKYQELKSRIKLLIQTEDVEKLKSLMTSIRNYRNAGMMKGGEFSVENLVFKALRHGGDLEKLKTAVTDIYDRKVSLPEEGNRPSYKKTRPLTEVIGNRPFLIVGMVFNDLSVKSEIDYKGAIKGKDASTANVTHWEKGMINGIQFRYNSNDNTIYWWPHAAAYYNLDDKRRDAVLDHLHTKYNVVNPKQAISAEKYFDRGHFLNEVIGGAPFLVVGMINSHLDIESAIDYKGATNKYWDTNVTHDMLRMIHGIAWRYKSKLNTIYWASPATEKQKDAVVDYLDRKYSVVNPKHSDDYIEYTDNAHFVNESLSKGNVVIGNIDDYLDINNVKRGEGMNHSGYGHRWRYKHPFPAVFWWESNPGPTQEQKDAVADFLKNKYNVDIISHRVGWSSISDKGFNQIHTDSPEFNPDDFTKGKKLDESLIDKNANLYLGVIKRSNLKVVGRDVEPDESGAGGEYTHDDFLRELGGEWDAMWDDEMIRWRYKRSENSIYWWYSRAHPTEDEKESVERWLMKNVGLKTTPTHKWISQSDSIVKRHPDYYKNRWASHDPSVDH